MKLDISHIILASIIAVVVGACMYFKVLSETAGAAILTGLVGLLVPTSYKKAPPSDE